MSLHIDPTSNKYKSTLDSSQMKKSLGGTRSFSIREIVGSVVGTIRSIFHSKRSSKAVSSTKIVRSATSEGISDQEIRRHVSEVKHGSVDRVVVGQEVKENLNQIQSEFYQFVTPALKERSPDLYQGLEASLRRLEMLYGKNDADEEEILQLEKQLRQHITSCKSGSVALKELTKIGHGKAKDVWAFKGRPKHVFYTPVEASALFNSKESELRRETATARDVRSFFEKNGVHIFLERGLVDRRIGKTEEERSAIAMHLAAQYGTIDEIINNVSGSDDVILFADLTSVLPKSTSIKERAQLVTSLKSFILELKTDPTKLEELLSSVKGLAVDLTEVTGDEQINGKYTVRTEKAIGDLENALIGKNKAEIFCFPRNLVLGRQFLQGMAHLHKASYVHGDLKPENVLVYGKKKDSAIEEIAEVRVADFGKAQKISDDSRVMYTGNPRFAAPEGVLSKQSEVYSSALILIRMLEEELLVEKDLLKEPDNVDSIPPNEARRGIEKFLIKSADCPQSEVKSLRGKVRVYSRSFSMALGNRLGVRSVNENAEREIHGYIDELVSGLISKHSLDEKAINELGDLLKTMTNSDPAKRGDLSSALNKFEDIMRQIKT